MRANLRLGVVLGILLLGTLSIALMQCTSRASGKTDSRGSAYADPKTCMQCHQDLSKSYAHTSHFNTSRSLTGHQLPTGVKADSSVFIFNDSLNVKVENHADGQYQTAYWNGKKQRSARTDVVFGAGAKAFTFAYWDGDVMKQLPLSYFNEIHNWANSPGFPLQQANFDRAIVSRCLECHSSYAEKRFVKAGSLAVTQEFDQRTMIYGIDCQRCHGPAAQHVTYHQENPTDKQAKFMVRYHTLTRQQKVDVCAVCHSGNDREMQKSTFGFKPGDTLSRYTLPFGNISNTPDVHGNQANLLALSKCYANSAVMTCTTCHDPHQKEVTGQLSLAQKCLTCHKTKTHNYCKMAPKLGAAIDTKCIDCHMPAMPSKLITYQATAAKQVSAYYLHTHKIAVYPDRTRQIIAFINEH